MSVLTSEQLSALRALGEPFAAGFCARPDETMVERFARGLREWAGMLELPQYNGEILYPHGPTLWNQSDLAVGWYYVAGSGLKGDVFQRKLENADSAAAKTLETAADVWRSHEFAGGYTHSIPNYGRVLKEGLEGFDARIRTGLNATEDRDTAGFYRGMHLTLDAARILHERILEVLRTTRLKAPEAESNRNRLIAAYERIPWRPAQTFFEALVCTNFVFYFDGCDDLGRIDQFLLPYYESSEERGDESYETAVELICALWKNVDAASAWNAAIGGTDVEGRDLSNTLTLACLEAARGMRRPNLALRLGESTPDTVWEGAVDCIVSGCGLPALYWDPNYFAAMDASNIPLPDEEKHAYAFGGCTELMVHGKSNVGSLDGDLNLPEILVDSMNTHLVDSDTFESFIEAYKQDVDAVTQKRTDEINRWQEIKSRCHPQPIRSLLIDDCIDDGVEFAAGGARYNWSVINVMGLANVIDSLSAIREIVYEKGELTGGQLLDVLHNNFEGHEALRQRMTRTPRYGNGDEAVDALAADISRFVFDGLLKRKAWRGGPFVPSCLMFVTYAHFGQPVGATPDGRFASTPIADSAGPYQGRDMNGPTAMLRSTASLDQKHAPGTLVVNLRLGKQHFEAGVQRDKLKALLRSYFDMGGLQLQVNVIDQATLEDAVKHPERYGDLIVRVGGYSEYWRNLGPELRESILLRTEH